MAELRAAAPPSEIPLRRQPTASRGSATRPPGSGNSECVAHAAVQSIKRSYEGNLQALRNPFSFRLDLTVEADKLCCSFIGEKLPISPGDCQEK